MSVYSTTKYVILVIRITKPIKVLILSPFYYNVAGRWGKNSSGLCTFLSSSSVSKTLLKKEGDMNLQL